MRHPYLLSRSRLTLAALLLSWSAAHAVAPGASPAIGGNTCESTADCRQGLVCAELQGPCENSPFDRSCKANRCVNPPKRVFAPALTETDRETPRKTVLAKSATAKASAAKNKKRNCR